MQGYAIWYITSDRDLVITAHYPAESAQEAVDKWHAQPHNKFLPRHIVVAIPTNTEVFKYPKEVRS